MPNYGVIDLGSNTIRLCVYHVPEQEKKQYNGNKRFRSLLNNRVVAGLSSYVVDGKFTDEGIERTLSVLKGHHKRLKYFNCERTDVFATAVIRNCANSDEVIKALEQKSEFTIHLLSGEEEAHLGFIGATYEAPMEQGTLIDIGGGSTEFTRVNNHTDSDNTSIPIGSLSSFSSYVTSVIPTKKELSAIEAEVERLLDNVGKKKQYRNEQFYGIGGSLRAAAKVFDTIYHETWDYGKFTPDVFDDFIARYKKDPDGIAHAVLKVTPERVHTLMPGCMIARGVMRTFGAKTLSLRKKGVREGYLIERILDNPSQ